MKCLEHTPARCAKCNATARHGPASAWGFRPVLQTCFCLCAMRWVTATRHVIHICCFCDLAELAFLLCHVESVALHQTVRICTITSNLGVPRVVWQSLGSLWLVEGGREPKFTWNSSTCILKITSDSGIMTWKTRESEPGRCCPQSRRGRGEGWRVWLTCRWGRRHLAWRANHTRWLPGLIWKDRDLELEDKCSEPSWSPDDPRWAAQPLSLF